MASVAPAFTDLTQIDFGAPEDSYEVWEVRSDTGTASLRASALPREIALDTARTWTDEAAENFKAESAGPVRPTFLKRFVAVKVESIRTVMTD